MCPWGSPDIGHTRQNFKSTVLNVHKELKETMGKEDGQGVMAYQSTELSVLSWEPVPGQENLNWQIAGSLVRIALRVKNSRENQS